MSSVDQINVDETTYDFSPGPDGTLRFTGGNDGFVSGDKDEGMATQYEPVSKIDPSVDDNKTIFNKITTMISNIRYLKNSNFITQIVNNAMYPVGSIYMNRKNINPRTVLGVGVWQRIGSGRFIVAATDNGADNAWATYTGEQLGGSNTVTIQTKNLPRHKHELSTGVTGGAHVHSLANNSTKSGGSHTHTYIATNSGGTGIRYAGGNYDIGDAPLSTSTSGSHTHDLIGSIPSSGSHSHTGTTDYAGGQADPVAIDNRPSWVAINIWYRTS